MRWCWTSNEQLVDLLPRLRQAGAELEDQERSVSRLPGAPLGRRAARRARAPVAEARAIPLAERQRRADRAADRPRRGPDGTSDQGARLERAGGRRSPAARARVGARAAIHDQGDLSELSFTPLTPALRAKPVMDALAAPSDCSPEGEREMLPFRHLYLHVPFCKHKCGYCDFNAYAGMDRLMPDYVAALNAELSAARQTRPFGTLRTVYLGGGTPSLLPPDQIASVLNHIRSTFD